MKAIATRTIKPKDAEAIATYAIEAIGSYLTDSTFGVCSCEDDFGPCTCGAGYQRKEVTSSEVIIWPDSYDAEMGLYFPLADTVEVYNLTIGGHYHALRVNIRTGRLTAVHEGARLSEPGLIWELLPCWINKYLKAEDWMLEDAKTSRPDWGVRIGLLSGQFGEGPCNLHEAIQGAQLPTPAFKSLPEARNWWSSLNKDQKEALWCFDAPAQEAFKRYLEENPEVSWNILGPVAHDDALPKMLSLVLE